MTSGFDVEAQAGLTLQVGRLASALEAQSRQDALNSATRFVKSAQQVTVPVSGIVAACLGGPSLGYAWTVRRISVSDSALLSNTVAGTAGVYAGTSAGVGLLEPENLEWIITPLPNVAEFSSDQLILQYGESLYVQVAGGTSTQLLKVGLSYQLYKPSTGPSSTQV